MLTMLHMAARRTQIDPNGPLAQALREYGDLVIVEVYEADADAVCDERYFNDAASADAWLTSQGY